MAKRGRGVCGHHTDEDEDEDAKRRHTPPKHLGEWKVKPLDHSK